MNTIITQADKAIWADAYRFWSAYHDGKDEEKFWNDLVHDADLMCEKHEHSKFINNLIYACVEDIEFRYKEQNEIKRFK